MRLISRVATAVVLGAVVIAPVTEPVHSRVVADTHGCCPRPRPLPPSAAVRGGLFPCPFCEPLALLPAGHGGCC